MEQMWRVAGVQLGKQWKIVALAVVAITVLLFFGLQKAEFATGQDSYLNQDSQVAIDNVSFQDQFGGETVIFLFTATEEDSSIVDLLAGDNLAEIERFTAELEEISPENKVITPAVSIQFSEALIKGPARNALLSAAGRADEQSQDSLDARGADIPVSLGRIGQIPEEEQVIGNPAWNTNLMFSNAGFAADGTGPDSVFDMEIRSSLAGTFPDHQTAVGGMVLKGNATLDEQSLSTNSILEIMETVELDGWEVTTTGSPVYLKEINDYLETGMLTLGIAAIIVMALVLIFLFRVRWRLLPLLGVIVGIIWTFSLLGYLSIDLSLVTISGLPILIGLGIDFAIQIHNRVEEEAALERSDHPISETLANVGPPLTVATIGAILAFLALQISQVPMIRDFGIMLAIGVGVLLISGVVIPTATLGIREYVSRTDTRKESIVEKVVVGLGSIPTKFGPILAVISVALFVIGISVEGKVKIESDPLKWIDQNSEVVQDIDFLSEETGFSTTLGILVESNNVLDQDLNQMLWDFTRDAEERPEVVASSSMVNTIGKILWVEGSDPVVPTPEDLQGAIDVMPPAIKAALVSDDLTATQLNLRLESSSLEDRAVLVADIEADLQSRIDALDLPAESALLVNLEEGADPVKAVPSGLAVVGTGLLENLSANRAVLTYLGLAIVALWLVVRHRSLSRALLAMVPVSLAVGVSSIIVGLSGISLSPLTTVGGPLVIATCSEFSILILARYLEERQRGLAAREATDTASARTGRAFFTSAVTTIGGFATLLISPLPLLRDFGVIVTMNVAVALLAALVVMPPLLVWADEKGFLATKQREGSVKLAADDKKQLIGAGIGAAALVAAGLFLYASADKTTGSAEALEYTPTPLAELVEEEPAEEEPAEEEPAEEEPAEEEPAEEEPAEEEPAEEEPADGGDEEGAIDVSQFGTERPTTIVGGALYDNLTGVGGDPQQAVCTSETL